MAGEVQIAEWTGLNVGNANFNPAAPYAIAVDVDAGNSDVTNTAVKICAAASAECIGVAYDKSHLNPDGSVTAGSGVAVRSWGIAALQASAAITAGAYVEVSSNAGDVRTKAQAAAGAQPGAIVGRALTNAAANHDIVMVLLMIGCRY